MTSSPRHLARLVAVSGFLLLGTADLASAGEDAQTLKAFDTNGDGTLTSAEASAGFSGQFASMDADKNGALSEDEYVNARLTKLSKLDPDNDGAITQDEMRSTLKERFREMRR